MFGKPAAGGAAGPSAAPALPGMAGMAGGQVPGLGDGVDMMVRARAGGGGKAAERRPWNSPPPGRQVAGGVARSLLIVSGDRPSCTRARHMTHEHMNISHNTSNGIDQTRPMPTQDDIRSQKLWSQMVLSQTQIAKNAQTEVL